MAKTVVIFGGSGGLGSQVSRELSKNPEYNVFAFGSKDLNFLDEVDRSAAMINADIVLNFAGVNVDCFLHKLSEQNAEAVIDTAHVAFNSSMAVFTLYVPHMRKQGYGRVIMISSILSTMNIMGTGYYSASKAFVDKIVQVAALENASKGVTVNSIQLGYFDGGMTYKVPNLEKVIETIPLKRLGNIEELVKAINFLIETEYVTGTNLRIGGGL